MVIIAFGIYAWPDTVCTYFKVYEKCEIKKKMQDCPCLAKVKIENNNSADHCGASLVPYVAFFICCQELMLWDTSVRTLYFYSAS